MQSQIIIVMGASGCGKSTIGKALSVALDRPFIEGDDCHPPENRAKMQSGQPLTDSDRAAWLDRLLEAIRAASPGAVVACSALTAYVQERLRKECGGPIRFCLLELDAAALQERVSARSDHFMPATLVASQLDALSAPHDALRFDAGEAPDALLARIIARLEQ